MKTIQIYGLYSTVDGVKSYFYVGQTTRGLEVRAKEHLYNTTNANHTEDVYEHIRRNKVEWDIEELCLVKDDAPNDCEDFYVVLLIRAGFELMNMKKGDAKKLAELNTIANGIEWFASVKEFNATRERVRTEAFIRSEALRRRLRGETEPPPEHVNPHLAACVVALKENAIRCKADAEMAAARKRIKTEQAEKAKAEFLAMQNKLFNDGVIDALGNKL